MEESSTVLFLAKISRGCPEPAEQTKELCRTIVSRIGVSSLTQLVANGIEYNGMNLPMESVLTPAKAAGFLHSILLGASRGHLQQMSLDVTDVQEFIKELLQLPEMDGLTHLHRRCLTHIWCSLMLVSCCVHMRSGQCNLSVQFDVLLNKTYFFLQTIPSTI